MALSQTQLFEDPVPLVQSCPTLNDIRLADEIKELTIEVMDGGRLHVHRIILAARVPSMRAKLSGPLTQENSVIRWPTVPLSIASAFISYVYTGRVEMTQNNVRGMIALARMMEQPDLENWGASFMASRVTFENLATMLDFASTMKVGLLMDACTHVMQTQFRNFVRSDLFACLPADRMLALIQDDNLDVDSEEEVFAAISTWVGPGTEDSNERLKLHAPTMLREVRWLQTTVQFRCHLMDDHPMFQNSIGCARLLGQVEQWMRCDENDKRRCPFNEISRRAKRLLVVFGMEKDQNRMSVLCFDSDLQKEERIADMEGSGYASYSVLDDSIFVIGEGTRVQEFLVRERRWRQRAPLAVGRRLGHAAAVVRVKSTDEDVGGEKTLIGVFGGSGPLSSSELYDVRQDRWFKLPDLREKRWAPAAVCLPNDSRVFVFGGNNGSSQLASVEFCQLEADYQARVASTSTVDFWKPAAPMRIARSGLAASHFRGRIVVAGGHDGHNYLNVVELFSPPDASCPRGQWTELAGMKQPRGWFTLLTTADAVFALGNDVKPQNTVEALTAPGGCPDLNNGLTSWMWSSKSPVETLRWIRGAVSIRV